MEQQKQNNEKLTDQAFSRLLTTSILGILACIVCLCSTTYAWFSDTAPSRGNEIKMAEECLLTVEVTDGDLVLSGIEEGVMLEAGVSYTVTLTLPANSSSGYCLVLVGDHSYYTDYIARHSDPAPQTRSFTLISETSQTVRFEIRWGIYAQESDVQDGILILP